MSGGQLGALLAGVAAAPMAEDSEAWLKLAGGSLAPAQRAALVALQARVAKDMPESHGLPGWEPGRVGRLRAELARRELSGFLCPRGDEHQGEYVAPYAERLYWLTGFTGSAGLAIVLADRAAIFVDGRYTLQVQSQVDGGVFDVPACGSVVLPIKAKLEVKQPTLFAVTVEKPGGVVVSDRRIAILAKP